MISHLRGLAPGHGWLRRGWGPALRGLFCGGTLADEAMLVAGDLLADPIRSNIAHDPDRRISGHDRVDGHVVIDFGDDGMTQGRAHPMIDQRTRIDRMAAEGADPTCSVLLLDVVLGRAANPDPAAELAPAIAAARARAADGGRELAVVVSLCATHDDPQDPRRQAELLHGAGASVWLSNAAAARWPTRSRSSSPATEARQLEPLRGAAPGCGPGPPPASPRRARGAGWR